VVLHHIRLNSVEALNHYKRCSLYSYGGASVQLPVILTSALVGGCIPWDSSVAPTSEVKIWAISYCGVHGLRLKTKTPWPESASELYPPSDRRLSAKLVSTFEDSGSHVIDAADQYDPNLGFLDRSSYLFYQVAPQLYSRG
jgi:hypothetical protein